MKALDSRQQIFVNSLVAGASILNAAKEAGVSEVTGHAWKKKPEIKSAVEAAMRAATQGQLQAIQSVSFERTQINFENVSEKLKIGAAETIDLYLQIMRDPNGKVKDRMDAGRELIRLAGGIEKTTFEQKETVTKPRGLSEETANEIRAKILGIRPLREVVE